MRSTIIFFGLIFSSLTVFAQNEPQMPPASAPAAAQTMPAPGSDVAPQALPEDQRVEAECREWAAQDGVPEDEMATYVKECIEDRAAQE